jgi:hypothetical protein
MTAGVYHSISKNDSMRKLPPIGTHGESPPQSREGKRRSPSPDMRAHTPLSPLGSPTSKTKGKIASRSSSEGGKEIGDPDDVMHTFPEWLIGRHDFEVLFKSLCLQ